MQKNYCVLLVALVGAGTALERLDARDSRTPLLMYRGTIRYPLNRNEPTTNKEDVLIEGWTDLYTRGCIEAFGPCGEKVPLTQLFFGKSEFTLAQAFYNSAATPSKNPNPWITITKIAPRFDYREQGAVFGLQGTVRFGCDNEWRSGLRVRLPYRDVTISQVAPLESGLVSGSTLADVYQERPETNSFSGSPVNNQVTAARLDFLSTLLFPVMDSSGNPQKLVVYSDPATGQLLIGEQKASGGISSGGTVSNTQPGIAVISRPDGSVPTEVRWGNTTTSSAPVVAANGSGLGNNGRGRFVSDVNYSTLGSSVAAQSQLWVVPNINPVTGNITEAGNNIFTAIANAAASQAGGDNGLTKYLIDHGISFDDGGRVQGQGDLDMEWFLGYDFDDNFWGEVQLALRAPTGKRLVSSLLLAGFSTGNNGHWEVRPGLRIGISRWEWFKFHADLTYSWVLPEVEELPAPFKGATVKNIGPDVSGKVSWSYLQGNANLTFYHPKHRGVGWTFAYAGYSKGQDKIKLCQSTAQDFNGNEEPLDASILTFNTHRVSHKVQSELFCPVNRCTVWIGVSATVAGKNISRDTDLYIGVGGIF